MSLSVTTVSAKLQREDIDNRNVATSGTIASTGAAVTGTGTMFTSEAEVNDWIAVLDANGDVLLDADNKPEMRLIEAIASDTALTMGSAFTDDAGAGTDYGIFKFLTVPGVVDTTGPELTADQIDNTTQDDGTFRSQVPGLIAPGAFSFNILVRPELAAHQGLLDEVVAQRNGWLIKWFSDGKATAVPPNVANSRWLMNGAFGQFSGSSPASSNEAVACNFIISGRPLLFKKND